MADKVDCEHVRQVLVKGGCRHRQRNKRLRQRVRGAGTKIQSEQRLGQAVSLFKAAGYEDQAQRVRNIGSRKAVWMMHPAQARAGARQY